MKGNWKKKQRTCRFGAVKLHWLGSHGRCECKQELHVNADAKEVEPLASWEIARAALGDVKAVCDWTSIRH